VIANGGDERAGKRRHTATRACVRVRPGEEATTARLKMTAAMRVLQKIYVMVRCGNGCGCGVRQRALSAKIALFQPAGLGVLV
jgi:hypothetical protein